MLVHREVRGDQRIRRPGHSQLAPQAARDRLDRVPRQPDRLPDPLANPLRPQPLAGGVHRNDAGGVETGGVVRGFQELVLRDVEAPLLQLAPDQEPRAGLQPVGEPRPVEPDRLRLPARVEDVRLQDRQAATARRTQLHAGDLDLDRRLLPQLEVPEPDGIGPIAIAVGDVSQQVPQVGYPELGRGSRQLRAGPAQIRDGPVEERRAWHALQGRSQQALSVEDLAPRECPRDVDGRFAWCALERRFHHESRLGVTMDGLTGL